MNVKQFIARHFRPWNARKECFCSWCRELSLALEDVGDADVREAGKFLCEKQREKAEWFHEKPTAHLNDPPVGGEYSAASCHVVHKATPNGAAKSWHLWQNQESQFDDVVKAFEDALTGCE